MTATRSCSTSSGGSSTSKSTPIIAMRNASQLRSSSPVRKRQRRPSSALDGAPVRGDAAGDRVERRVQRDHRLEAVRGVGDALGHVGAGVLRRQCALREAHARGGRPREAIEPERAPVLAPSVPRDQVPAPTVVDERVGLDLAAAGGAVPAAVAEADELEVAARGGDHGQVLGIDGGTGDGQRDRRRPERRHAPAQVARKHLLELQQRAHRRLLDPGDRRPRGRAQADRDRDRLVVVEQQRRHRGARAQAIAAARAGEGVDRIPEPSQAVDVAPDRAAGHLEPLRELARRAIRDGPEAASGAPGGGSRSGSQAADDDGN